MVDAVSEKKYVLALDQGTTSSRAILFNHNAKKISSSQLEIKLFFPKSGWVEQDAQELFLTQLTVMKEAVNTSRIDPEEIAAVGIANQRETVILWDKETGVPVYHAIVWQCRRTASMIEELSAQGKSELIRKKTGLIPDAYFSATKIKWILDNVEGVRQKAEQGKILAGTVDTWLIWKLTGGKVHVTDCTNASRTMLYNIHECRWDEELLQLFDIPESILPQVKDSSCVYGVTDKSVCGFEIPVASCIGDQQAALFGQACFEEGNVKTTFGTGCFMLMNTGSTPIDSKNNLLTTIAIGIGGKVEYALEGSVFMGGAVVKWLRDQLGIIRSARECDVLAESVSDTEGVVMVPAFTGLGSPYWDPYARGMLIGLTRGSGKAHICRAALEGIACQVKDVLEAMRDDYSGGLTEVKVDGGACVSDVMMQFLSDILDMSVFRPKNVETTALGAAYCAGLAVNFWKSRQEIVNNLQIDKIFTCAMTQEKRREIYSRWKLAVERSRGWAKQPDI
ncbi:glycerol kinase [Treponema rectale]|uniref:Glycerol kinase n=1 Tax=Treponema rectale TaxID=744512 RepID=A0A840S826_9SPIR|nr:glycerol kinase GlpK [Treponema rectale]MBB5217807.1 glycerol kinase [Treponema rectale]QOS40466.1 glycerol kinase [Treponema rectale]